MVSITESLRFDMQGLNLSPNNAAIECSLKEIQERMMAFRGA
jgi:hypothetical protein